MLIGVISDTHIPARAKRIPQEALDAFYKVDLILHAGDLTCLEAIEPLRRVARVIAVRGNMDGPEVMDKLNTQETVPVGKRCVGLTHGVGKPGDVVSRVRRQFDSEDVDVVVFGHSHQAMAGWLERVYMFNPGSATDALGGDRRSVGLLQVEDDEIHGRIVPLP